MIILYGRIGKNGSIIYIIINIQATPRRLIMFWIKSSCLRESLWSITTINIMFPLICWAFWGYFILVHDLDQKKKMSIFITSSPTTESYYKILQYIEKLVIDMVLLYKKGTDFHTAGNVCIWLFISFKTVCVVSKQIFYIWIRVVLKQFLTFDVFLWPLLLLCILLFSW